MQYNENEIEKIYARLMHIVQQVIRKKEISFKDIEVVTDDEKLEILKKFNDTKKDYPKEKRLYDFLEENVMKFPQKDALYFEGNKMSYCEFNQKVNSLANYMYDLGLYRVPWLWSLRDIIHGIYEATDSNKLDIRLGGYFDEEVLSGSQGTGFAERNEIFPHMTSSNCSYCTNEFVNAIKQFNMTYDVSDLDKVKPCPHCYSLWQDTKKIRDSRSIFDRVKDVLGKE